MPVRNATKKSKSLRKDQTNPALRRALGFLLLFVSTALLANAVIGERGLIATRAAEREAKVLAGGRSLFDAHSPIVLFEVNNAGQWNAEVVDAFKERGYG